MEKETVLATLWKHKTRRSREASDFAPDSNPDDGEQSGGQGAEGQVAGDQWPLLAAGPRPRGSERWGTAALGGERRPPAGKGGGHSSPSLSPSTQKLPICLTHGSLTWGER